VPGRDSEELVTMGERKRGIVITGRGEGGVDMWVGVEGENKKGGTKEERQHLM